jgi:hypothetical protein
MQEVSNEELEMEGMKMNPKYDSKTKLEIIEGLKFGFKLHYAYSSLLYKLEKCAS